MQPAAQSARDNGHEPAPALSIMSIPADLRSVRTLADLLAWRIAATPDAEAYRHHDEARGAWLGTSWRAIMLIGSVTISATPPRARLTV